MSTIQWQFKLDDRRIVQLVATGIMNDGRPYDLHEQVGARSNFCGVKYAQLRDAKQGVIEVTWLRYNKWREAFR